MTEQELRDLVRDAIARRAVGESGRAAPAVSAPGTAPVPRHGSHALFTLPPGDPDGRCMIESGVACNHCGYCKSYGH